MNYIITKNPSYFEKIGEYNFCSLEDMILPKKIAIDTETTGLSTVTDQIFCVQIGTGENNYIIQLYDDNYEFEDVIPFIKNKTLVGHNITFDLGFFYKHNFYPKDVRDTMIANKILFNGKRKWYEGKKGKMLLPVRNDFGSVMEDILDIKYDKTDQKNINVVKLSQASSIKYSFNDVDKLLLLESVLENELKKKDQLKTYYLHCEYTRALAYMERCGLPINPSKWQQKMIVDLDNQKKYHDEIVEYIYDNLPKFRNNQIDLFDTTKRIHPSLTSQKQMIPVFKAFEIKCTDKDGKESIAEDIISKTKHPFVDLWLKFQEANHRVTTFGQKVYDKIVFNGAGYRLYSRFNPMVDTARLSSRKGEINFLNFPRDKETRKCFECEDSHKMIVCDWSAQETVIAAELSGDEAMTNSVVNQEDLHCMLAKVLFPELQGLSDEEITKNHSEKRTASKAPRFAMSYGGNAYTLHLNEGIPYERALEIEQGFKDLHSGLYIWGDIVFHESVRRGYISSADGWRLYLPFYDTYLKLDKEIKKISREEWDMYVLGRNEYKRMEKEKEIQDGKYNPTIFEKQLNFYLKRRKDISKFFRLKSQYQRLCLNNPVQTTGAHQLKKAKILLFNWIVKNKYQDKILICNSPHDEIILETINENLAHLAKEKLEECMLKGGNHYLTKLKIKASANIGQSWEEAK